MTTETLRLSAHCGLFIDRVVAFDKSENQEWPFARILVLGKFSVRKRLRTFVLHILALVFGMAKGKYSKYSFP